MERTTHFFRLLADDVHLRKRWFPDEPIATDGSELDARDFTQGVPYTASRPATLPIAVNGPRPHFTFAAFDMPVVSSELADRIESVAPHDIQRFPVIVEPSLGEYEILNVVTAADCIDEARSKVEKWTIEDGRPEKIGQYRAVSCLRIDQAQVGEHDIFRVRGWTIALIVSDRLRLAISGFPNLGLVFDPVTE